MIRLLFPFIYGLASAITLGIAFRMIAGMRLHLYLIDGGAGIKDQAIIPITSENRKSSLFRTLLKGRWKESVDLTLLDYSGNRYHFLIGYHLWRRFYLILENESPNAFLNRKTLKKGKRYYVETGMRLTLGDRQFKILVSSKEHQSEIYREFAENLPI